MVSAERNGWGRVSRIGLAGLNKGNGLWGIGTVPSCLIHGSGVMGQVDSGLECDSLIRNVVWGHRLWIGRLSTCMLYMKHTFVGKHFIISRNWQSLLHHQGPRCWSSRMQKAKDMVDMAIWLTIICFSPRNHVGLEKRKLLLQMTYIDSY